MPLSGPSAGMQATAGQSSSLASQLNANYAQNFGAQSSILGNITNELNPILEAGPNQEGFSAAEKSALNSSAISNNAGNYKNAAVVAGEGEAGAGGSTYAPTGGQQEVQAGIASQAAGNLSQSENQINQLDYATGRANFENAEGGLQGVANTYNPNGTATAATNANSTAFGEENTINQQEQAPMQAIGGLAGAAIQGGLGNIDTTGGSTGPEQLLNFVTGL